MQKHIKICYNLYMLYICYWYISVAKFVRGEGMDRRIKIEIPQDVDFILRELEQKGFEAFAVGGCVRDSIIGRQPQDWDIATSAKPEEVKAVFPYTIDTGLKHGTVTVLLKGEPYEITTYRVEGRYIDNRRPETVEFVDSISADLGRRDFTINAMAYNPVAGLVDPYGGIADIEGRQIRAVGQPDHRFEEDALRMLRAVRFSAQLGYAIAADTLEAIGRNSALIKNISAERLRDELSKTLLADPMAFLILQQTGILKQVLPELDICFEVNQINPYHIYNVGLHSLHGACHAPNTPVLRWTMLLHDIGKADTISTDSNGINHFYQHQQVSASKAENVLQRLRFDNASIARIKKLILEHDRQVGENDKSIRKAISAIGVELFEDWLLVRQADTMAQNPQKAPERLSHLAAVRETYKRIAQEKQCLSLKELAVSGDDLMQLGIPQGKKLGQVLQQLLEAVLEQPELNDRERLLELSKRLI